LVFCRRTGYDRNREGMDITYIRSARLTRIEQVVSRESATIGDARENRSTIHGDHISMVKFSTKDDPGYKKVLNSIEMLLEGLADESLIPKKQGV